MSKTLEQLGDEYADKFGDVVPYRSFGSEEECRKAIRSAIKANKKIVELDPKIYTV